MEDLAVRYRDLTVAATGAGGYLASALMQGLRRAGASVLAVSRQDIAPVGGLATLRADVRTRACWDEIMSRADVIFHLAGNTSVREASRDPAASFASTVLPILHLVEAARQAGRHPRVVFASTATVYGLVDTLPVDEDVEPHPITTYDLHKLAAEKQLELASAEDIVEGVSLRLANVYGPSPGHNSSPDRGILNTATRVALDGGNLEVFGDGAYLRDYVYVDDTVRAFIMAGVQPGLDGRMFNVGSGTGVTIRDAFGVVASQVERVIGRPVPVRTVPWPANSDRIEFRHFTARIDRIHAACGWQPTVPLAEGIDLLISALIARPKATT
jgi:nucleoside-diphosphate-sugar epimerase